MKAFKIKDLTSSTSSDANLSFHKITEERWMSMDWHKRSVDLENTVYDLENQVKTLLRSEFKMYETQKRLEKYLGRVEEFNRFALKASSVTDVRNLLQETLYFCVKVYNLERAHLSYIGEFDSFSMLLKNDEFFDEDPLMQDIRHGKVNYGNKVQFIDCDSAIDEIQYLKDVFNISLGTEDRYVIFNLQHGKAAYVSLILKTKPASQIARSVDQPSRDDMPLFLALHRMLQSELSNKVMREELENKVFERTKESERTNAMLRRSLLTLQELQSDLIQSGKLAAIGEISSSIAHEINNPLFVVQGRLATIKKMVDADNVDKEKLLTCVSSIEEMQTRIIQIIKGLKNFSRDSRHEIEEEFSMPEILEEVNVFLGERIKASGVDIGIHDGSQQVKILAKKVEFSQVMINLVGNAIDAISERDEKWIKIDISRKQDDLIIRVIDSGVIDRSQVGKLFKPFYSTKQSGQGTGLGLSISRRIVERYNGSLILDLESEHTCFVVTFPIAS